MSAGVWADFRGLSHSAKETSQSDYRIHVYTLLSFILPALYNLCHFICGAQASFGRPVIYVAKISKFRCFLALKKPGCLLQIMSGFLLFYNLILFLTRLMLSRPPCKSRLLRTYGAPTKKDRHLTNSVKYLSCDSNSCTTVTQISQISVLILIT